MAQRSAVKLAWYRTTQWGLGTAFRLFFGVRTEGSRHVPATGPVVLLSNHQSHLDPPLIGCFTHRPLAIMARDTLFRGVLGALIRSYDAIPIDREGSGLAGIRATLKRLKQGSAVLMFPEGTRSADGKLQPLKPGFCSLVRRGGVTIVPMAIAGAYEAWPRTARWPRPRRIAMVWGQPLSADEIAALSDSELIDEVTRRIADCFATASSKV
jgi:1-acyl-sn-glycerol-3-phosphate acyltransferase